MGTSRAAATLGVLLLVMLGPHLLRGTVPLAPGSDPATQFFPWLDLARESLLDGEAPLWNPFSFAGSPLLANSQSAVFYPLNFIYYVLPTAMGLLIGLALRIFLHGLFTFLLLRRLGVSEGAARLGMVIASASGYLVGWLAFPIANVVSLLPAALYYTLRLARKPSVRQAAMLALVLGAQVLGGQPQSLAACWALTACFGLWALRGRDFNPAATALMAAAGGLGVGLGAAQLLPFWEYLQLSAAYQTRSLVNHYWYPPAQHLISFVQPDFFGPLGGAANWGFTPTREMSAYVGVLPLVALMFSWRHPRLRGLALVLGAFCGVALAMLYRWPSFAAWSWLIESAGLQGFGVQKLLAPVSLCLALLAALGLDRLLAADPGRFTRRLGAGHVAVGIAVLLPIPFYGACIEAFEVAGDVAWATGKTLLLLLLGFAALTRLRPGGGRISAMAILLGADLLLFGWSALPPTPMAALHSPGRLAAVWEGLPPESGRIDSAGTVLSPNFGVLERVAGVRGYDALTPAAYMRFVDAITASEGRGNEEIIARVRSAAAELPLDDNTLRLQQFHRLYLFYGEPFLELLRRARYGFPELSPIRRRHLYDLLNIAVRVGDRGGDEQGWVQTGPDAFRNLLAQPRVRLAEQVVRAGSEEEMLSRLISPAHDPARAVVVLADDAPAPPARSSADPGTSGSARITSYRPRRVAIEVSAARPSWLVLADLYFPGWTVLVDGRQAPLLRADYLFRAVVVPAGRSTVEFVYEPALFALGKWVSLASLLAIVVLIALPGRRAGGGGPERPASHSRAAGMA